MNYVGEPKNLRELLDRLKKNPLFKFVPRQDEPLKDPWNVKSRLLIDDDEAEAIVASLLENECTSPHQGEKDVGVRSSLFAEKGRFASKAVYKTVVKNQRR